MEQISSQTGIPTLLMYMDSFNLKTINILELKPKNSHTRPALLVMNPTIGIVCKQDT